MLKVKSEYLETKLNFVSVKMQETELTKINEKEPKNNRANDTAGNTNTAKNAVVSRNFLV